MTCVRRAALVLAAALALASCAPRAPRSDTSSDAPPPGVAPGESLRAFDSTFLDQSGRPVTLASFGGRPVVLAMVYTRCRSTCPRLVADVQRLESHLTPAQRKRTWFVLVSLDPGHDRPDTLAAYAREHRLDADRWRLLTGGGEAVRELAELLGVRVREDGDGVLAHSSNIYLLDSAGVVRAATVGVGGDVTRLAAARVALP